MLPCEMSRLLAQVREFSKRLDEFWSALFLTWLPCNRASFSCNSRLIPLMSACNFTGSCSTAACSAFPAFLIFVDHLHPTRRLWNMFGPILSVPYRTSQDFNDLPRPDNTLVL
jgi:hypothetical protein